MVHIGPVRTEGFGLVGTAYRLPHGRASILFVVVAGIGISLLAGSRAPERVRGTTMRLAWRALVLLPAGLALQTLDVNVAVILHYYALWFLLAIVAVRLPDRVLGSVAVLFALAGPVAVLAAGRSHPDWFEPGFARWSDAAEVTRDLFISGTYPSVVWAAPLLVGILVGRRGLRSNRAALWLAGRGAALAGACYAAERVLGSRVDAPASRTDWRQLAVLDPHNEMPLWILSSTGAALAIVGSCLLLARLLPRALWPAAALGQLALTVYVGHVLALAYAPGWLERDSFSTAWPRVGIFVLAALAFATGWRAVAPRGPLEAILNLPWWVARRVASRRRANASLRPLPE